MTLPKLSLGLAALAGISLALGGCGGGGGGGGSSSAISFDGSGTEASEGYWVIEVTSATGLYATDHYAIPGWTQHIYVSPTATGVDVDGLNLVADPATKTYVGTNSYSLTDGALDAATINEDVTMSFAGGSVYITMSGTSGTATGSYKVKLHPIFGADNFDQGNNYFYGETTQFSGGNSKVTSKYVGETHVLELGNWSPVGTYGYIYLDATYNWSDSIYIDAMYLDGTTLKGGGYYDGSYINDSNGGLGDAPGGFAKVTIQLGNSGLPQSTSFTYRDYEANQTISGAANNFKSENQLNSIFTYTSGYELTVDTVTAGGVLQTAFGIPTTVNTDRFASYGYYAYVSNMGYFYGTMDSPTKRTFELWDGRYYEDTPAGEAGYELDGISTTPERYVWTVNYDADGVPTGGSVSLKVYDASFNQTATESMTFTISGP